MTINHIYNIVKETMNKLEKYRLHKFRQEKI